MKTIGVLGGMSWESTLVYYRLMNEAVRSRCGGLHSAPLLLHSVDFAHIRTLQQENRWAEAGTLLAGLAVNLEQAGAELLLIATNTMHKVAQQVEQAVRIPLVHIVDPTAKALMQAGIAKVALFGTSYTMEQDFYTGRLHQRFGIEALVPNAADRALVDRVIFDELCLGNIRDDSRKAFQRIMLDMQAQGAEGIILGCTEIGLLIGQNDAPFPLFDTTVLHAQAAVALSCGDA